MELILAILFFSLSGTVCIQLFAKAYNVSQDTVNQNNAITQAQNLAEGWLAMEGDLTKMEPLFQESVISSDGERLYLLFDEDWNLQAPEISHSPAYIAELTNEDKDERGLIHASIRIIRMAYAFGTEDGFSWETEHTKDQDPIYTLELSHHIPERRGGLE